MLATVRRVPLDFAKPGMVIAKRINDKHGQVVLPVKTVLDDQVINQLKGLQISFVYIADDNMHNIKINEILSEETRTIAIKNMRDIFHHLKFSDAVDSQVLDRTIDSIAQDVFQNRHVMVNLTDVRSFDAYIFAHSVNVAMLSILTGTFLGYNHKQLEILGLGALMHDLGKTKISKEILFKPGPLTTQEFEEVKIHTKIGYDILKEKTDLPPLVADIAYQHHEKMDGSGYPQGIKGHKMHEFSHIVAITNVFDALLSDRPYRKGLLPHEAAEIIANSNGQFDPHIVRVFLQNVAIYPMGTLVELNTGEVGVVIDVNKGQQTRPIIRLLGNQSGQKMNDFKEVDLSKERHKFIVKVLQDEKVCQYLN